LLIAIIPDKFIIGKKKNNPVFFAVAAIFKDVPAAILFLLVHYKSDPYNYFIMVEELLPGACLVVVLFSLIRNFQAIKSQKVAYVTAAILLFFIVRSHPLALLCLAGALPVLYLSNREFFIEHRKAMVALGRFGFSQSQDVIFKSL